MNIHIPPAVSFEVDGNQGAPVLPGIVGSIFAVESEGSGVGRITGAVPGIDHTEIGEHAAWAGVVFRSGKIVQGISQPGPGGGGDGNRNFDCRVFQLASVVNITYSIRIFFEPFFLPYRVEVGGGVMYDFAKHRINLVRNPVKLNSSICS